MNISGLINKKKAMNFNVSYHGSAQGSGLLGAGVETYHKPTVSERIKGAVNKFQQKKAEQQIIAREKPQVTVKRGISFNSSVIKERLAKRSQEHNSNSLPYAQPSNQQPYFMQTSNNMPYYLQGERENQAWSWLTKSKKK